MDNQDVSLPTKYLLGRKLIVGRVMDLGCSDTIALGAIPFDPTKQPFSPNGIFDTIVCNYILDSLDLTNRKCMVELIRSKLAPKGIAYISVCNGCPELFEHIRAGVWPTQSYYGCTWLGEDLPIETANQTFIMYRLQRIEE